MTTEIKSPTFPESVADGTIANWVKKEGDSVKQDEVIAEIETDKVVLEVVAPFDGVVSKVLKPAGETVLSAELIAEFTKEDINQASAVPKNEIVAEPELNEIYDGKVVKTVDFGAFVNFLGARDGLVHISELKNERVAQTIDVVKEGDMVKVKVIGFDNRGKVKLSMKRVDQETGADIDTTKNTEQ